MRVATRASAIGVLGIGLSFSSLASSQGHAAPAKTEEVTHPAPSEKSDRGGASSNQGESGTVDVPKSVPSTVGGYSWSKKGKGDARTGKRREAIDPNRPLVQAPSFQVRSDGTSLLTLTVSRPLPVVQKVAARRVEYLLKGAQVGIENNLNPLVTEHFATPLVRAKLRRDRAGLILVLELRENVQPVYVMREGVAGTATLAITLPQSGDTSARGRTDADRPKATREKGGSPRKGAARATGPGPLL
ncbi:MAG TPA: hypothetical protein VKP30_13605 [Polyangiaceae bacterium]|nr:hypothetical protein [Polyangiaceae bacterium]